MSTYTQENVETALCLWEAMLEMRDKIPALNQAWLDLGTAQIRSLVPELAAIADEMWLDIPEDQRDGMLFDWEHCPDVVRGHDWSKYCHHAGGI